MSAYPKTLTVTDLQAASMDRDALSKFRSVPVHNRNARMYYMDSEEEVRRMLKLIEDAKAAYREEREEGSEQLTGEELDLLLRIPRRPASLVWPGETISASQRWRRPMIDPKDPQSIADNPDAIRVLALEAKKDLGPLLQVVGQAVVLHDLDPMWLEYVARHYAEAHEDIPVPLESEVEPECKQCGGKGGWDNLIEWVDCPTCEGTGVSKKKPSRSILDRLRDSKYPQRNTQAVVASTPWTSDEKRRTAADALARFLAQGGIHR